MITVALPIYKCSQIAWLAFEGLCNQKQAPEWELIVCEEIHDDSCAEQMIEKYRNNLYLANCKNIILIKPSSYINLAKKWQLIGRQAHKNSEIFLLQAADDYSHSLRLKQSYNALKNANWYHESEGYFFDLAIKIFMKFNRSILEPNSDWKTGLNIAFKTKFARNIPDYEYNSGIDHFLFRHVNTSLIACEKPLSDGLFTDSANIISKRRRLYRDPNPPFEHTNNRFDNIDLPKEVINRLNDIQVKEMYFENKPLIKVSMGKYKFLKSRNHFRKGEEHELSDVVASFYLQEGIVEPLKIDVPVEIKEYKKAIETKEEKFEKPLETKQAKTMTNASVKKGRPKK